MLLTMQVKLNKHQLEHYKHENTTWIILATSGSDDKYQLIPQ